MQAAITPSRVAQPGRSQARASRRRSVAVLAQRTGPQPADLRVAAAPLLAGLAAVQALVLPAGPAVAEVYEESAPAAVEVAIVAVEPAEAAPAVEVAVVAEEAAEEAALIQEIEEEIPLIEEKLSEIASSEGESEAVAALEKELEVIEKETAVLEEEEAKATGPAPDLLTEAKSILEQLSALRSLLGL